MIYDREPCSPEYGYLKANRADLKQVMLSLVQGEAANIPLWMEALDGNSSDKTSFQETVRRVQAFTQSMQGMPDGLCFVVNAAFYVPEQLAQLNNVFWITRVPAQLKEAKTLLSKPSDELNWEVFDKNYRGNVGCSIEKHFYFRLKRTLSFWYNTIPNLSKC